MSENCLYFVPILHLDERIILGSGSSFSVLLFRNLDPSESNPVCVCFFPFSCFFSLVSGNHVLVWGLLLSFSVIVLHMTCMLSIWKPIASNSENFFVFVITSYNFFPSSWPVFFFFLLGLMICSTPYLSLAFLSYFLRDFFKLSFNTLSFYSTKSHWKAYYVPKNCFRY